MTHFRTAAALGAALVLASAALALQTGDSAPPFKLADQFGKVWDSSTVLDNNVVVIVAADRESGRAMGPWVENLKKDYGKRVQLLGLLQLRGIPGIGRGIARSKIRKETKDPLMIDFNGDTGKAYDVSSQYPVVVVIDKSGNVSDIEKTEHNAKAYKATCAAIDKALR